MPRLDSGFLYCKKSICICKNAGEKWFSTGDEEWYGDFWQFRSGIVWNKLFQLLKYQERLVNHPNYLIIHCGVNNIGQEPTVTLLHSINKDLLQIAKRFPSSIIVWSQILPRLCWRHEHRHSALEEARKRINKCIASFLLRMGGKYLRYPDIVETDQTLFCDGVHLSSKGDDIFLQKIKQGILKFTTSGMSVCPDNGGYGLAH